MNSSVVPSPHAFVSAYEISGHDYEGIIYLPRKRTDYRQLRLTSMRHRHLSRDLRAYQKLRRYVAMLGVLFLVLVLTLAIPLTILHKRHPGFGYRAFSGKKDVSAAASSSAPSSAGKYTVFPSGGDVGGDVGGDAGGDVNEALAGTVESGMGSGVGGASCGSITEHFRQCEDGDGDVGGEGRREGNGGGCSLDGETALCLLTKTKADLDSRTQRLDEEVYNYNSQLEHLIPRLALHRNLSDVYSRRPNAHLHHYYSHEYSEPSDDRNMIEPLRWTSQSGLSSLREIDVTKADNDSDAIISIRVLHPGYYYVYNQVTFTPDATAMWSKSPWMIKLFKNYRCVPRLEACTQSLLMSNQAPKYRTDVSYMQGIFLLMAGETLTVLASPATLHSTSLKDVTFFGAFRI